ncbi:SusC/RagA family TonB-linked outer membrane protein [Chitinophaga sp. sic0106]|uniref:SusC/RagA family TonB-linked outer membrane protein n=1 Tax=Chitinophaga sp. sic0106 TaxID=2854785 RepID=UPI001C43FFB6|nr:SusC/RagA family TonB-linked outer membrane protein [Chitinophaga sp. sic0106]MBV7531401.1 SusC/RagA family TonB-linked outer membrane protein [Chitinophaga sp. sic0106]
MKMSIFYTVLMVIQIQLLSAAPVSSQDLTGKRITMELKDEPLLSAIKKIEYASGLLFAYPPDAVRKYSHISLHRAERTVAATLNEVLHQTDFSYRVVDSSVVLYEKRNALADNEEDATQQRIVVTGSVTDEKNGDLIVGATIMEKRSGSVSGTTTNELGIFKLPVTLTNGVTTLQVRYVGYDSQEIQIRNAGPVNIRLSASTKSLNAVIVTGLYSRPAENFTGAAASFTKEDLNKVTGNGVMNALRALDPSFQIPDNLLNGSNPNTLPDVTIRGGNSLGGLNGTTDASQTFNYTNKPNTPLFIMDGFEVNLQRVADLDLNRIAKVTILKDAAATAIYGSRAANGVVVIETIRPREGRLRVSYTGSLIVETPDLKGYDLLNASEKLELEKQGGIYNGYGVPVRQEQQDFRYNYRKELVAKGVNTDWLAIPLRNGVGSTHNLYLEGGNETVMYGMSGTFNNMQGVMKNSGRRNITGNTYLSYRYKNFLFRNDLTLNYNKAQNSNYGNFYDYTKLNPYWSPYDENGNLKYLLEDIRFFDNTVLSTYTNPLYNTTLHTVNASNYENITNNFFAQWQAKEWLRFSGRFSYQRQTDGSDDFLPGQHTSFNDIPAEEFYKKGSYTKGYGLKNVLDGSFTVDMNKSFGKHLFFSSLGATLREDKFSTQQYTATGFPNDRLDDITMGATYKENDRPLGAEGITRLLGYFANVSYAYDNRYLLDVSYRLDGSSQFGSNKRFAPFWSVGGGWNLHKEKLLANSNIINRLKLRYSYGYTGSSNFSSYLALTTSKYYTSQDYLYNIGTLVMGFGNPNLAWQQTAKSNVGLDATLFNKLDIVANYFVEKTQGTVVSITTAPSTGFSSYMDNMGDVVSKGYELNLRYTIYSNPRNRDNWSVFVNAFHTSNKIERISNTLQMLNKTNTDSSSTAPLPRYAEGRSTTAIWAVPSLGIDPASGREIYLKRDGTTTNTYDPLDQVIVGDSRAKIEGTFGTNLEKNGIGLNLYFRFRQGGYAYNQTLVDRVENADLNFNVDRRVYEERWKKPGDITFYKGIVDNEGYSITAATYATSRFVQADDWLSLESASVYYRFSNALNKRIGLQDTKISLYTGQVFYISSIKRERGLDYPFSRSFTLQLQTTF